MVIGQSYKIEHPEAERFCGHTISNVLVNVSVSDLICEKKSDCLWFYLLLEGHKQNGLKSSCFFQSSKSTLLVTLDFQFWVHNISVLSPYFSLL